MKRTMILLASAMVAGVASADITSVMLEGTEAVVDKNLTAEGTTDWVMLGRDASTANRDEKMGADYIGAVTVVGTPATWGESEYRLDWDDGIPTLSTTGAHGGWEAKPTDINVLGEQSLSFSVANLAVGEYAMMVYADVAGTGAEGTLTATMGGAMSASSTGDYAIFSVDFEIVNPTDSLDIFYNLDTKGPEEWSNVSLSAVTIAAVPEPSTLGLLGAASIGIFAFRRRLKK